MSQLSLHSITPIFLLENMRVKHWVRTGIETAAMISLIIAGSDMRATPPSFLMSDGTRSSACDPRKDEEEKCKKKKWGVEGLPQCQLGARSRKTGVVPTTCHDRTGSGSFSDPGFIGIHDIHYTTRGS